MSTFNAIALQQKFIGNFIDAYRTLDINNVAPFISETSKFQTFPKAADRPIDTKKTYIERFGILLALLTKLDVTVHEVIENPGKIVLRATCVFYTIDGTVIDYDSLTVFTLAEEDGELKITDYKDFSDPEKRDNLFGWVQKKLAKGIPVAQVSRMCACMNTSYLGEY